MPVIVVAIVVQPCSAVKLTGINSAIPGLRTKQANNQARSRSSILYFPFYMENMEGYGIVRQRICCLKNEDELLTLQRFYRNR